MKKMYVINVGWEAVAPLYADEMSDDTLGYVKSFDEAVNIIKNVTAEQLVKKAFPETLDDAVVHKIVDDGHWNKGRRDDDNGYYSRCFHGGNGSYYIVCKSLNLFEDASL